MAKTKQQEFSRTKSLSEKFNGFWNKALNTPDLNYYQQMSISDLINLKKAVATINNIVTMQTTCNFAKLLQERGFITSDQLSTLLEHIEKTNANSNGYDVEFEDEEDKIVAEVKCNIPVKENAFGSAQKNGIIKDINGLISGKSKSTINTDKFFKFMVILNDPENHAKTAMEDLIKNQAFDYNIEELPEKKHKLSQLATNTIYVVYIQHN